MENGTPERPSYIPPETLRWWVARGIIPKMAAAEVALYQTVFTMERKQKECFVSLSSIARTWGVSKGALHDAIREHKICGRKGKSGQRKRPWEVLQSGTAAFSRAEPSCEDRSPEQNPDVLQSRTPTRWKSGEKKNSSDGVDGKNGEGKPPEPLHTMGDTHLSAPDPEPLPSKEGSQDALTGSTERQLPVVLTGSCQKGANAPPPVPAAPLPESSTFEYVTSEAPEAMLTRPEGGSGHTLKNNKSFGGSIPPPPDLRRGSLGEAPIRIVEWWCAAMAARTGRQVPMNKDVHYDRNRVRSALKKMAPDVFIAAAQRWIEATTPETAKDRLFIRQFIAALPKSGPIAPASAVATTLPRAATSSDEGAPEPPKPALKPPTTERDGAIVYRRASATLVQAKADAPQRWAHLTDLARGCGVELMEALLCHRYAFDEVKAREIVLELVSKLKASASSDLPDILTTTLRYGEGELATDYEEAFEGIKRKEHITREPQVRQEFLAAMTADVVREANG